MVGESSAAFERFESNFRGVLLVINRWSNYSTYRCIRTVGGYFIAAMFNDTWKKSSARARQMFVNSLAVRQRASLYTWFLTYLFLNQFSNCFVLNFSAIERKKEGSFLSTDFFFFFLGDRSDSIYFNGASSCSLTIRLRMAFHGIMGHSLWKFLKELSFLEGGKSFRRIYIYTQYIKHDSLSLYKAFKKLFRVCEFLCMHSNEPLVAS